MMGLPDQTVLVRRPQGDFTNLGTWETASFDEFEVSGSLQPVGGEYAQQFPEYIREQVRYVLYLPATAEVLNVAKDSTRPADQVRIQMPNGETQDMVVLDRVGWASAGLAGVHVRYVLGDI